MTDTDNPLVRSLADRVSDFGTRLTRMESVTAEVDSKRDRQHEDLMREIVSLIKTTSDLRENNVGRFGEGTIHFTQLDVQIEKLKSSFQEYETIKSEGVKERKTTRLVIYGWILTVMLNMADHFFGKHP